jgi:FKBP-type peptidyl-prolyl cis-trans isomerase FkpA
MTRAAVILSTVLLGACITPTEIDDRWEDPDRIEFAASLDVDLTQLCTEQPGQLDCWHRTASGLYWKDLVVGTGAVASAGDSVRIHYTGWLPDGNMVHTTHDEDNTPEIIPILGKGLALKGLDEGLVGMRVKGKRKLVIRPSLAYGRAGNSGLRVPPLATLVFEVELIWARRF